MNTPPIRDKPNAASNLLAAAFLVLGVLGILLFARFQNQAFPFVAVDFRLDRNAARHFAADFLESRGFKLQDFDNSISFNYHQEGKDYLERTLGLVKANPIMRDQVPIWFWEARWFRSLDQESFLIQVDPAGRLVAFIHEPTQGAHYPSITEEAALNIAREFLVNVGPGRVPVRQVERERSEQRTWQDWTFTWERTDRKFGSAALRYRVTVRGRAVEAYDSYLEVPQDFIRQMEREQENGGHLSMVGMVLLGMLLVGFGLIFFQALRARELKWHFPAIMAAILAVIYLVMELNGLEFIKGTYNSNENYVYFWTSTTIRILLGALFLALLALFAGSTGAFLYRKVLPNKIPLEDYLRISTFARPEFLRATAVGYGTAFIALGYLALFYLLAQRLGAWVPADLPYDDILSTPWPWTYPLFIGFSAALTEEFIFRLAAITLLVRLFRNRWLAIIIPAAAWALLHCTYPQQPFYIRALELFPVAILLGWIFLRFGFWATFIFHYALNSALGSLLLLFSSSPAMVISGLVVMNLILLPLILSILSAILPARAAPSREAEARPGSQPPPYSCPTILSYAPLSSRRRYIALAAALAGIAALWLVPVPEWPRFGLPRISDQRAKEISRSVLLDHGVDPAGYQHIGTFDTSVDDQVLGFLHQRQGADTVRDLLTNYIPAVIFIESWITSDREEAYEVALTRDGRLWRFSHYLPIDAPGASLSEPQALQLALRTLSQRGIGSDTLTLIGEHSTRRKDRVDHSFLWKDGKFSSAGAELHRQATVQGNEVVEEGAYIRLPDDYVKIHQQRSTFAAITMVITTLLILGLGIHALFLVLGRFQSRDWNWVPALYIAGIAMAALLIFLFTLRFFLASSYESGSNWPMFILTITGICMMMTFVAGLLVFVLGAAAGLLYQRLFPNRLPIFSWLVPGRGFPGSNLAWRDAWIAAYGFGLMQLGLDRVLNHLGTVFPSLGLSPDPSIPLLVCRPLAMGAAAFALLLVVAGVAMAFPVLEFITWMRRRFLRILIPILLVLMILAGSLANQPSHDPYSTSALLLLLLQLLLWVLVFRNFFGHNLWAYGLLVFILALRPDTLVYLWSSPLSYYRIQGMLITLLALGPLLAGAAVFVYNLLTTGRKPHAII